MRGVLPALAFALCAAAQSSWPIQSLAVEGNQIFSSAQILAVAGLKIGDVVGKPEFDAARDRLTASGAFETVGYKFVPTGAGGGVGNGYAATFIVSETTSVFPVQFGELGEPDADIEKALTSRDPLFSMAHLPANQLTLDRDAHWLEEYLATKGKHNPIAASVNLVSTDHYVILFRPKVDLPAVAQVTFEGNRIVAGSVLRNAITATGIGSQYSEPNFRKILEAAIRPVYEERGRLKVTFPQIRAEAEKDVKGVHVFVTIDEGEVYKLGKISLVTPTPLDPDRLLAAADLKSGDLDTADLIATGLDRMRKALRAAGYLDAKTSADRRVDDAKKTADIDLRADAGDQYLMGTLAITGLDPQGEAEIKRLWNLKEGAAFNAGYPDPFVDGLVKENVFDHLGSAKAEVKADTKTHTVSVTLIFLPDDSGQPKPSLRKIGY